MCQAAIDADATLPATRSASLYTYVMEALRGWPSRLHEAAEYLSRARVGGARTPQQILGDAQRGAMFRQAVLEERAIACAQLLPMAAADLSSMEKELGIGMYQLLKAQVCWSPPAAFGASPPAQFFSPGAAHPLATHQQGLWGSVAGAHQFNNVFVCIWCCMGLYEG